MDENVRINPQYVYVGKDIMQEQVIKCKADVADSLHGKYFLFHDTTGAKHAAMFKTSVAVIAAPVGGWTVHDVVITTNAPATTVATALQGVLDAVVGFDATVSGFEVTLKQTVVGYAMPARDTFIANKMTNFSFNKITVLGQTYTELGCIDGDIEIGGMAADIEEIKCHHSGTTPLMQIIKGYKNPEIKAVLQETAKENYKKALIMAGMITFINEGNDQLEVFGWGAANIGGSNPRVQVEFHPVSLDTNDKSEDITFWTCELMLEKFDFSGEKKSTIPMSFKSYSDKTKPKFIDMFMVGDAAAAGF